MLFPLSHFSVPETYPSPHTLLTVKTVFPGGNTEIVNDVKFVVLS